ncbi:MAG: PKD-like domain-containing protein, partial [Sediminibacterium sp.]
MMTILSFFIFGRKWMFRSLLLGLATFGFAGKSYSQCTTPVIGAKVVATCSGVSFSISPTDGVNGDIVPGTTVYSWNAPAAIAGISGLAGATNATFFSGTLTNSTGAPITLTYLVTPASFTCTGASFTVTVTVNLNATINPLSTTVCTGVSFNVTPTNGGGNIVPVGTVYTWETPVPENASLTGGVASSFSSTHLFGNITNPTHTASYVQYTVTPTFGSCVGPNFIVDVHVDPRPAINAMSATFCSGVVTVTPVPATNGENGTVPFNTFYSWGAPTLSSASLTAGGAGSKAGSITVNLINNSSTQQSAVYTVNPSAGGCAGNQFTLTIFVNPSPSINNISLPICSGSSFSVSPVSGVNGFVPNGTQYTWAFPIYSNASVTGGNSRSSVSSSIFDGPLNNPTSPQQTASYRVSPSVGACIGASFTLTVSVDSRAAITAMTAVACSNSLFTINPVNGTNGLVPVNTTYAWNAPTGADIGNGQPGSGQLFISGTLNNAANDPRTATYLVTPSTGSCSGSQFTLTVTVNPAPVINPIYRTICTGTSFALTPTTGVDGFVPAGTTFTWDPPIYSNASLTGGSSRTTPSSHIFDGPLNNPTNNEYTASYNVKPQLVGNCQGSSFSLVVSVVAKPTINAMSTVVCGGTPFVINPVNILNGIVPVNVRYDWAVPTGSNIVNGQPGINQTSIRGNLINDANSQRTATYIITPYVGGCIGNPFTLTLFVDPAPLLNSINRTICSGTS